MMDVSDGRFSTSVVPDGRPSKRMKVLLEDDSDNESSSSTSGGVAIDSRANSKKEPDNSGFKVNEEYARRFEHNQRRAEIHRCT